MRVSLVVGVVGNLLRLFSLAFLAPLLLELFDGNWWGALRFAESGLLALAVGTLMSWGFEHPRVFYRAEALAVVSFTWLTVAVAGAVPYVLEGLTVVDAFFESMSGLTTTGATILTDFGRYDRGFFLWRAMTQWFGGLGVIALFIVVLPRLGIAGRQLFFAESSGAPGEAVSPKVHHAASRLWILYCAYTGACVLLLWVTGFSLYEAVCHALTTLAAGGFSPNGSSIAGYENPGAEWVLIVFMFLAGASYPLQVRVWRGELGAAIRDGEFLFYSAFTLGGALLPAIVLAGGVPGGDHLRMGLFQSTSLISSTGFASVDYNQWPDAARAVLLLIMIVGGCAGSAAGGPKAVRHLLVAKHLLREARQTLHPRAVLPLRYKGRGVPPDVMRAVFALAVLYVGGYFSVGLVLTIFEVDAVSGFTAALACLGNIGPGFDAVGPMANFAQFSAPAKVLLTLAMWIGRLEILAVLALLHPDVWRDLRWRGRADRGPLN